MDLIHVVFLGIVEGLTEFLPISSTFHLIWAERLLGINETDFVKLFDVFIQGGAILAVVILYRKIIFENLHLMKRVAVAFIPTAIIGLLLYKVIKNVFLTSFVPMLIVFVAIGVSFIVYEYVIKKDKKNLSRGIDTITYKEAVFVGIMQSLAVMPGVSRAGAVILAMMFLHFKRDESAKFSFLLAVPTILAAGFYDLYEMRHVAFAQTSNLTTLAVGFVIAFVSAYFVVKWFISYLQTHSLSNFGWYRIIAGVLLFLFAR